MLKALVSEHSLLFHHLVAYGSPVSEFLRWSLTRALTVVLLASANTEFGSSHSDRLYEI